MEEKVIRLSQYGGCWRADVEEETWLVNVGSGSTPWEASAEACAKLGEGYRVLWESLPWTETRIALGIVMGVAELFGATKHASRAIDAACYAQEMSDLQCSEYCSLSGEQRAELAAAAAERLLREALEHEDLERLRRACLWLRVAAEHLDGYTCASELLDGAVDVRMARMALRIVEARNAELGLCPDSWRNYG